MIESLLVANRGEIACRIFRTARRMNIRTVAVYSDADANARHVREADEAWRLGPAPARESYLDIAALLEAARASGAEAIHPGYGFLAENAQFAEACLSAGLTFVGPPPAAIRAMGSKILAKTRMRAAGVPVLPGYAGAQQELAQLEHEAHAVGLPLIIKPAAGGGGKGMQIVRKSGELAAALAAARRLAESAFGDGALLIERYLPAPRHLEVQVFADTHGSLLHLGDRDCSIQRRHQKLIEEAPAPAVPPEVRERLRASALVVAREIGYVSAGTVEFLFDGREFYFMEMNTRLQVEHTVTEAVTGLDLVEWQLRVAAGERLPLAQHEVRFTGHAIEARVCAEDPSRGFLPSAGRLTLLEWPVMESVRVDAGFGTGDTVPDNYDSLLGKVIAWAGSRDQAAARLATALTRTYCAGIVTNEHWLARILRAPVFLEVRHNIALLDEHLNEFAAAEVVATAALILATLAAHAVSHVPAAPALASPWDLRDGFMPNLTAPIPYRFSWHGQHHGVELEYARGCPAAVTVAGEARRPITGVQIGPDTVAAQIAERRYHARYRIAGAHVYLWLEDEAYDLLLDDPRTHEFSATAAVGGLTTPLPGVVVAVAVTVGAKVSAGDVLMVIEAMKMEHTITAPHAGTVKAIHFARGDRVPEGSELLELAPE
ncbi:MAG TPA: biotin carboxylase N-terminal domain-containing protein [Steroidobacteraceae bacterium]|nr:biotin carboxylase N-terminal domain-containing protein [Steroidobacteraceae bacterium]